MLKAQAARSPILLSKCTTEYFTNLCAAARTCTVVPMTDSLSQRMHNVQFQDLRHLN